MKSGKGKNGQSEERGNESVEIVWNEILGRLSWKMVNTGCRERKDDRVVDEVYERGRDDRGTKIKRNHKEQ